MLEVIPPDSTRISKPLFKRAEETYGAGYGFCDTVLIPRLTFIPCMPASRLAEKRKHAAFPVASTSQTSSPTKGKEKAEGSSEKEKYLQRLKGNSITKAGITRDKNEIARITYDATRGSKFFQREEVKDRQHEEDVRAVLEDLDFKTQLKNGNLEQEELEIDIRLQEYEKQRDLSQFVVCVDADAFYASVEELVNPDLIGKAFVVGSGIVLTASYEARKAGCRSAMQGRVAKKLLPDVIFVEPHFELYYTKSKEIMAVLRRYDPNMAQASLDEAYLNLTPFVEASDKTIDQVLEDLRYSVRTETGLTVSCGCGANKMLAKIATDINKPNGQHVIPLEREAIMTFMRDLPVRKIPGVGRITESWLHAFEIASCKDIWTQRGRLGLLRANLEDLLKAYLGIASNSVRNGQREDRGSCGKGWTFANTCDYDQVIVELKAIAEGLSEDLATSKLSGKTLSMAFKYDTFEVETRTFSGHGNLKHPDELFKIGKKLFDKALKDRADEFKAGRPVKGSKGAEKPWIRRISLRLSQLRDESESAMLRRGEDTSGMLEAWVGHSAFGSAIDEGEDVKPRHLFQEMLTESVCPVCERHWQNVHPQTVALHVEDCLKKSSDRKRSKTTDTAGHRKRRKKEPPDAFEKLMARRR